MKLFLLSSGLAVASTTFADTITVCKFGCDHSNIQAAIDAAAEEGDVIEIGAGIWRENLSTRKQLILRGLGHHCHQ